MGHLIIPETGVQLFRGEAFLSSSLAAGSTTTTALITSSGTAQSVAVASSASFAVGNTVVVDTGANVETVVITAIADGTHITAIFSVNHASGVTISKGGYQNTPVGQLQDFEFSDDIDVKEMRGPKSRMAIAVAQSGLKVSGSCKFGASHAQILSILRGATLSTVTSNGVTLTKISRKANQNIIPCVIELFDVDNESGAHALFYNVLFQSFKTPQKLDDFTIWDASFLCYPDKVNLSIYDLFYPGDQTGALTLPTGYTADTGLTTAETDYATSVGLAGGHVE